MNKNALLKSITLSSSFIAASGLLKAIGILSPAIGVIEFGSLFCLSLLSFYVVFVASESSEIKGMLDKDINLNEVDMSKLTEAEKIALFLDDLNKQYEKKLSVDVKTKLFFISQKIKNIITVKQFYEFSVGMDNFIMIKNIATKYLNQSLQNYVNVQDTSKKLGKSNKEAEVMMIEQLTIMEEQLNGIIESLTEQDMQKMKVYSKFLNERFNTESSMFTV